MSEYKYTVNNPIYKMQIRNLRNHIKNIPVVNRSEDLNQSPLFAFSECLSIAWCIDIRSVTMDLLNGD